MLPGFWCLPFPSLISIRYSACSSIQILQAYQLICDEEGLSSTKVHHEKVSSACHRGLYFPDGQQRPEWLDRVTGFDELFAPATWLRDVMLKVSVVKL